MIPSALNNLDLLAGPGSMRALMREHDWSTSLLGSPSAWPPALRTMVSMMLDSKFPMFVAWGSQLGLLYNDAYAEILGAKHPHALGRGFQDAWEEIWDLLRPLIDNALEGGATFHENLPLRIVRKGHEEQTWFTFSYSPARDDNGTIAGMFCTCTETTGQILAERRQAFHLHIADRLRDLSDPVEIGSTAAEALGRHLCVARVGYGEVDGTQSRISVTRDWTDGSLPSLAGEVRVLEVFGPTVVAELSTGRTLRIDDVRLDVRSANYAKAYAEVGVSALLAVPLVKAGRLRAVMYLHQNRPWHWADQDAMLAEETAERLWSTVERARAEENRRRAEEALSAQLVAEGDRLRKLFEQAPGFMAVLRGPDHVFELANAAFLRLIGGRPVVGKPLRAAMPELEGQQFFEQLDRVFCTAEPYHASDAPVLLQRAPGAPATRHFVDFIYQPVMDSDGSVTGIFVEGYDVTERRLAHDALRTADRRKDEFLAMLAHELRNPLAPISNAAELLKILSADHPRVRQTSEIIARQVEHMTGLVDDLLDVARVTSGLVKLDMQTIDIRDIVSSALEQVRGLIEARGHRLTLQFDDSLVYVEGDRTRLVQVMSNLINNAAKYTPEGGELLVRVHTVDDKVQIAVSDTGIGIEPALLPHVFELFTQAERSPDRSQGGLGLGLALVQSLVELHDGSVKATSAGIGLGSTFTLCLPHLHLTGQDSATNPLSSLSRISENDIRVMIVDDNVDAAESMALLLQADGHQVAVCFSAQEAISQARITKPGVFLLDIGLPDMDGHALARQLRNLPETAHAVLIALTGYGQSQDYQRSKEAGFDHHLVKPARASEICALLAELESAK